MSEEEFNTKVLGQQVRHHRKEAGLTLVALGELINRPASYLSQLENGHIEPKLKVLSDLANALNCETSELLSSDPPNKRASLEIELQELQNRDRKSVV